MSPGRIIATVIRPQTSGRRSRSFGAVTASVEKRRQRDPALRAAQQRTDAVAIGRVQPKDYIGLAQRGGDRAMAEIPGAPCPFCCVGGFGDRIGNAERIVDDRAEPIRRLVVEVIGQPQLGRFGRRALDAASAAAGARPPARQSGRAAPGASRSPAPVKGAQPGRDKRFMAGEAQRVEKQPRHAPVTRGDRVVRRLERCVNRDAHRGSPRRTAPARRPAAGRPNSAANSAMPPRMSKARRTRSSPAAPSSAAPRRVADQRLERRRQRRGSPGGTSSPVCPCSISSAMPGNCVATQASRWLCASISTLGRPSRSS